MRYFLGVHHFAPLLAIYGDMGWIPSQFRRWINMVRYWNRPILFNDDRITKMVFNMDYMRCSNNWCSDLKDVLTKLNLTQYFERKTVFSLHTVESHARNYYCRLWKDDVKNVSKLKNYVTFKT